MLKGLTQPKLSQLCGRFLDSSLSIKLIPSFIKKNEIDMEEYEPAQYHSFNEFFYRQVKKDRRPIDYTPSSFVCPCDGLLSVIPIREGQIIPVKQSQYTVRSLLRDKKLAEAYKDGWCLVFRLCVNHYHRYMYNDQGIVKARRRIKGILHTVRPIALEMDQVFVENSREYMILETENFDQMVQMEVGAMLVGKIDNYHKKGFHFERGQEKGRFLYGGSTIILLVKDGVLELDEEYKNSYAAGEEIPVKMGQVIGRAF